MNAFSNHTTIVATATPVPAHQVIASLANELRAAGEVLSALHHFSPMATLLHAMAELRERGVIDQELKRNAERSAVLSMAKQYLSQRQDSEEHGARAATSQDLVRRLRAAANQSRIQPPALDLEAAARIEHLEQLLAESQRSDQNETDDKKGEA